MDAVDHRLVSSPRICLEGALAHIAGAQPQIHFRTVAQAGGLLRLNTPELMRYQDTEVEVWLNNHRLGPDAFHLSLPSDACIRICPATTGGSEGVGKVVLGALLIVTGAFFAAPIAGFAAGTATSLVANAAISVGTAIALEGVATYLASQIESPGDAEHRGGGTYSGPRVAVGEGQVMPLLYGYARVGGVLIQRSLDTVVL